MSMKQKIQCCDEIIPDAFVCFMRQVGALIDGNDPAAWTESDDLLQCATAYGGLYDLANGRFGFAHLVSDYDSDASMICWYFDLDRQEIRDIAAGKLTSIAMWRCEDRDCGRRFPQADYYCPECDFPP